jgi:CheY-like chemotaxis protein
MRPLKALPQRNRDTSPTCRGQRSESKGRIGDPAEERLRIDIADNGRDAIEKLEFADTPYDAVLMDVQMPVLDGLEATRRLRRDARFRELPIIAMTAHAMSSDRERCLEAGMNGYVSKPVDAAQLLSAIEQFVCAGSRA